MQDVANYTRYCPDQPRALISDVICLGRRRSRYPQCPGCQFNPDDTGPVQVAAPNASPPQRPSAPQTIEELFVGYDIQAKYPEVLTDEVSWRIGHAAASYLRGALKGLDRTDPVATALVVGRDNRPGSSALCAALSKGARSTGATIVDVGVIDWPQLAFAINHLGACGGVLATGSARPIAINGFKLLGHAGRSLGLDTDLADICRIAQNMVRHDTGMQGKARGLDLTDEYRSFVRGRLRTNLRPMRIVVDAANGSAGHWLPALLEGVEGVELVVINGELNGDFAHDPDPLVSANLKSARKAVRDHHADLGVCFDGDASRLVLLDERAQCVGGDLITALLAGRFLERFPGSTVVYDLRSSRIVAEEIKKAGGTPRRERAGQAFIKKALAESKATFGGGPTGRFYFCAPEPCDSSILALVEIINLLGRQKSPFSKLTQPLRRYANSGPLCIAHAEPDSAVRTLAGIYADARVDFLDGITVQYPDWWFNARKRIDSEEPALGLVVEAATKTMMQQKVKEVTGHLVGR